MTLRQAKRVLWLWVFSLLLLSLLAACSGDDDSAAVNTDVLTQTLSTSDTLGGLLTVAYPEDWFARTNAFQPGAIQVGTGEAALDQASGAFPPDQVAGQVTVIPPDALAALDLDMTADTAAVLNAFSGQFLGQSASSLSLGSNETFIVEGRSAVSYNATITENGESLEIIFVAINEGDGFAVLFFGAAPGELADFEDEIRGMAGRVQYVPAAATPEVTPDATPEATSTP